MYNATTPLVQRWKKCLTEEEGKNRHSFPYSLDFKKSWLHPTKREAKKRYPFELPGPGTINNQSGEQSGARNLTNSKLPWGKQEGNKRETMLHPESILSTVTRITCFLHACRPKKLRYSLLSVCDHLSNETEIWVTASKWVVHGARRQSTKTASSPQNATSARHRHRTTTS
jgi:hypothetical protein